MTEDSDGILGNLPRSRPGVRSDKRASGKKAGGAGGAAGSPPAPKTTPASKARTKAAAKPRTTAKRTAGGKPPPPPPPPPPQPQRSADPIAFAMHTGEAVARTGLKVAARLAGEMVRRLPRP